MKRFLLLALTAGLLSPIAAKALPFGNDIVVESNLGEKMIVKESATQVQKFTKQFIISDIYNRIKKGNEWYEECMRDYAPMLGKKECKDYTPEKSEQKHTKRAQDYEQQEAEELVAIKVYFQPIFVDLNGMKSPMRQKTALCANPRSTETSDLVFRQYIGGRLKEADNLPGQYNKYSTPAMDQLKTKLCDKYAKF